MNKMTKSKEYWKKRFEILENSANAKAGTYYREIEKAFTQANRKIDAEISVWYQRFANNNNISLVEAKRLLNSNELKEFKWTVQEYIKHGEENALDQRWMKELENASAKKHISRLEALKIQTQQEIEVLYGNTLDGVDKLARDIYSDGYYHTAFEIQKGFNIGWDLQGYNDNHLEKVLRKPWGDGGTFSSRLWKHKTSLVNTLHSELTQNIIRGASPDDLIKTISKKFSVSKKNAGRLVMTESAYFSSLSQGDCYNDLGVERFEVVATLDHKTSPLCQDLDGKIFPMKDYESGVTAPPYHPWCRSTTVPYFDDNEGERFARGEDGKGYYIPSNMKYHDWKKTFVDGGSKASLEPAGKIDGVTLENLKQVLLEKIGFKNIEPSFEQVEDSLKIKATKQLETLENKFGAIGENNVSLISENSGSAMAYVTNRITDYSQMSLSLCPRYFRDEMILNKTNLEGIKNNFFMPVKLADDEMHIYTITHEYGHIVQNNLVKKAMEAKGWTLENAKEFVNYEAKTRKGMLSWYNRISNKVQKDCYNEIINIAKADNAEFDILSETSKYARTNHAEFFAEIFANSQLGKPNKLGLAMQKWLAQKGIIK